MFFAILRMVFLFKLQVLLRYKKTWQLDLELVPVLIGGIFKDTGNKSPLANSSKAIHMVEDIKRCSEYFKVPCIPINVSIIDFFLLFATHLFKILLVIF